jgi:protein gp37
MKVCALQHETWFPRVQVSSTLSIGRDAMDLPLQWKQPRHVFVMPGFELFERPLPFISEVFAVMHRAQRHEYQVTTRFPERATAAGLSWGPYIWLGAVFDGSRDAQELIEALLEVPAQVRFVHFAELPTNHFKLDGLQFAISEVEAHAPTLAPLRTMCKATSVKLFAGPIAADAEFVDLDDDDGDDSGVPRLPRGS